MFKVLIIDDNMSRVSKLSLKLKNAIRLDDRSIDTASSIISGKQKLKSNFYNILILDIQLPNRDNEEILPDGGVQLLKFIESKNGIKKPDRIIGVTAYSEAESTYFHEFHNRCFASVFAAENSNDWLQKIANAVKYSFDSSIMKNNDSNEKIVIAIHGIRTYGEWQNSLQNILHDYDKNIAFMPYKYGIFSLFSFFIPPLRLFHVHMFHKHLMSNKEFLLGKKIYIFSHSFGTYITIYALKKFTELSEFNIERIILSGSVLNANLDWSDLFKQYNFQLINDCGTTDLILLMSQILVPGVGMAGRVGFIGLNNGRMVNRYHEGGHDLYFKRTFLKENWMPCIKDETISHIDKRTAKVTTPLLSLIINTCGYVKNILLLVIVLISLLLLINSIMKFHWNFF